MCMDLKRCPTGIETIDRALGGGFYYTASVLLHGLPDAGHREFSYTLLRNYITGCEVPKDLEDVTHSSDFIRYITISKSVPDILAEFEMIFGEENRKKLEKRVKFEDLSPYYFSGSVVPPSWLSKEKTRETTLMQEMVRILDDTPEGSILFIDSVTDLALDEKQSFDDVLDLLKGLQLSTNKWNCLIYLLHTDHILDERIDKAIFDSADAVVRFILEGSVRGKRYRVVLLEHVRGEVHKLDGLLAVTKFSGRVTPKGFEVVSLERVS
jgi:KaiC/GvpD/RAD55 family RecA-like ATPase